jgi:phospholipid/cholesterol/gamma-HCH transport system ATP-binding protein
MKRAGRTAVMHKFGMLFQGAALFDSLRVWENVAFGLIQGRGMERARAREIALEKLAAVGLGAEVGELRPAELSGGMQKRVALARAIAAEPEIIFFDEPTTGLDPIMADVINRLIRALQKRIGVTSIVVTHDLHSAMTVGDRLAMIHGGRVVFTGTPAEAHETSNERVRQFIEGNSENAAGAV